MIRIRPAELKDAENLYRWRLDEEVAYWASGNYGDALFALHEVEEMIRGQGAQSNTRWFIINKEEKQPIGFLAFRNFDRITQSVSLSLFIGEKEEWGKGYGTEALQKFLYFLFTSYNLNRVELTTFPENERALRLYKKCGFVIEGRLRKAFWTSKGLRDKIVMGLLYEDWKRMTNHGGKQESED